MKTDNDTLSEILKLHELYVREIEISGMKRLSADIYKINSLNFVRWIRGEFIPGGKVQKNRLALK